VFALLVLALCPALARAQVEVVVTDPLAPQEKSIKPLGGVATSTARMFAAPGEYEPASFSVRPKERLASVMLVATDLAGDAGTIPASAVRVQSVEGWHGGGRDVLMDLGRAWHMPAFSRELFWATVHVPEDARPGVYRGKVRVTSDGRDVAALDLELEVLPIRLAPAPQALGFNYSSPKDAKVLAVHLADMRAHGMTTVGPLYDFHLPVDDEDTSEVGAFIEAYKRAGYTQPIYFATPMNLTVSALTGYGPVDSMRFQQKLLEVLRRLYAETRRHDVPVIFSIGDEFTNKGVKGVEYAGKLARFVWEEFPELATASDMNGYREALAMSPYLNVAAINNGWDGIDHHNEGRRLVNRAFLTQLQKETGAVPWFVNTGCGRFPYGFFFWKMARLGVRGKVEWYYNLRNEKGSVVRTDGETLCPTLDYERSREGIDDLRYLATLEQAVARAKAAGKAAEAVKAAEALLEKLDAAILDDWTAYTEGGETFPEDGFHVLSADKTAALGSFQSLRRAVADAIVAVEGK
jgi:hypothetical protein